jgi:hypothetical protein
MTKQNPDNLPFDERWFTTRQAREILQDGKTKFFTKVLPQLKSFLDGNKLKISGRSIREYQEGRLEQGRQVRPMPQLRKAKAQIESRPGAER